MAAMPAASSEIGRQAAELLILVGDISAAAGVEGPLSADLVGLARKVSLLAHLVDEIGCFAARGGGDRNPPLPPPAGSSSVTSSPTSSLADLIMALEASKRLLLLRCRSAAENIASARSSKDVTFQFQYVTWQLEKSLQNLPHEHFEISEEVQEEVDLVRAQLRRATEKHGAPNFNLFQEIYIIFSGTHGKGVKKTCYVDLSDLRERVELVMEVSGMAMADAEELASNIWERLEKTDHLRVTAGGDIKARADSLVIPADFRCPISLELMRDPVIVSTGQTYERSFIQRWIDCGNQTCPKTQQKLQHLTLTPNYVLRSLINHWCETNRIEQQPGRSAIGWTRSIDEVSPVIATLIRKLSSGSLEERRSAAAEIRSMAKRSTENRILIAEAGALPFLVGLLSADDHKIQEHSVTSLLNLSIYDENKEKIMLAGAIIPIVEILKNGSMVARENSAAAIFSLSLNDENKITIGGTPGAVEALVELLRSGSPRGKKDAATALFNLCIYQGNKARALRAGILNPLLRMLEDSAMVDEALTILVVLVGHHEGKAAIAKAKTAPVLIELMRIGLPRNKENAVAILLALCKKDAESLASIGRLGAVVPLAELVRSGTERAKRKATALLDQLSKIL